MSADLLKIINKGGWVELWRKLVSGGIFGINSNGDDAANVLASKRGLLTTQGAITATGAGTGFILGSKSANVAIIANGTHAGTTVVDIEVSLDGGATWESGGTLTVTGASVSQGIYLDSVWHTMRYNCTAFGSAGSIDFITEEL